MLRSLAVFSSRGRQSDFRAGKAVNTPLRMGKLRPEKGKGLFKVPSELVAGSSLELRSPDPQTGLGSDPSSL